MMDDLSKNIGITAIRTASHRINFSLLKPIERKISYDQFANTQQEVEYDTAFILMNEDGKYLDLSGCVQMDTSMSKNIVSTQIQGYNSTVKEWISNSDYVINLTVSVVADNESDGYPDNKVKEIINFISDNRALLVLNQYLNETLKVTRLVVNSYKHVPELYKNNQTITIDCTSDESYVLEKEIIA